MKPKLYLRKHARRRKTGNRKKYKRAKGFLQ